jgi:hypothetical protein
LLYPWQAALAASLQLALSILKIIEGKEVLVPNNNRASTAVNICCNNIASVEHRKASAAAVLKIVDPTHSRNTWLAASKGAEHYPASGSLLHLVYQLRVLLLRTSRRTAPAMLAGYLALARFILDTAAEKETENAIEKTTTVSTSASKAPWLPLKYVGHIVKSFCCYPPLLAASLNPTSAQALPKLASAGVESVSESTAYAAGLLWLILQNNSVKNRRAIRPEWLGAAIPEARSHPLVAAPPVVRSAAAAELLALLAEEGAASIIAGVNDNSGEIEEVIFTCLVPLLDACAAAAFCLHLEQEQREAAADNKAGAAGALPAHATVLRGEFASIASLSRLSSLLLAVFSNSAEALAALLDTRATTSSATAAANAAKNSIVEQRASFLGIGLEFVEIVSLITPLLQQADNMPSSSSAVLPVLERCSGVQGSCLELLRTLPEDSEVYLAAVRGLENAPVLALPPAPDDGEEEEEDEEENVAELARKDDGYDVDDDASDRVELSAYERRKRLKDIRNPYLRVIVAESRRAAGDAADGELSDLEDFIVANPERDYGDFIADHFPMAQESDGDEEDSEGEEERRG